MSQLPQNIRKKSTQFVEIIHSKYFHKHVKNFVNLCNDIYLIKTRLLISQF